MTEFNVDCIFKSLNETEDGTAELIKDLLEEQGMEVLAIHVNEHC